jgi:hypothetical protein
MPGNVGGGKDPCFWCAGERGNRAVIDDESTTSRNSGDLSIPLCRNAKRVILGAVARYLVVWTARVCVAVKPVGKLDVRNGPVQFDERVVSRTRREARCCTKDEGRSFGAALWEEASNCRKPLRPKAAVVNVPVKRRD